MQELGLETPTTLFFEELEGRGNLTRRAKPTQPVVHE
jgi:hypothetical protein